MIIEKNRFFATDNRLSKTNDFNIPTSDLWPPNSPDLNPVDYQICDTNDLKQCLIDGKDTISGVHVSPDSADTLVRRGGITNHHLIAHSLSNTSAKNYQNRLTYVEIIVCNISAVF